MPLHLMMTKATLRRPKWVILLALTLFPLLGFNPGAADPGDLDGQFGTNGLVSTDIAGDGDLAFGSTQQADGKILAVGYAFVNNNTDFAIARYNLDGSQDLTFSNDGKHVTDFASADDIAHDVLVLPSGRLLAAGSADGIDGGSDFALAAYNADGTVNSSFGEGGKVITAFGNLSDTTRTSSWINDVALQADGKIVAAGGMVGPEFGAALARYHPDGNLDYTFGQSGLVTTTAGVSAGRGLAIQSDGKIVVAGKGPANGRGFAAARYNTDGSPDTSFGDDGTTTIYFLAEGGEEVNSVVVQPDGKIVLAGWATVSSYHPDFAIARLNPDGRPDPTFGNAGKVTTQLSTDRDEARAIALQADGKLVAVGNAVLRSNLGYAVVRYKQDGTLDPSFGLDGKVLTVEGLVEANAVQIQPDGKIVVAGADMHGYGNFALARYVVKGITPRSWGEWGSLGGILSSAPSVTSPSPGSSAVFVRGADSALWWRRNEGSGWSDWKSLGGLLTSDPSAVGTGEGLILVAARGADNALWTRWFDGGSWGPWESFGGIISSDPALSYTGEEFAMFGRGADNALWFRKSRPYSVGDWSDWESLGGVLTSSPSASSRGPGRLDVFTRGSDSALWTKNFDSSGWSGWRSAGGILSSDPASVSWSEHRIDVFVRGADNALWQNTFSSVEGQGWSVWSSLGGILSSNPSAGSAGKSQISVGVRGADDALWIREFG